MLKIAEISCLEFFCAKDHIRGKIFQENAIHTFLTNIIINNTNVVNLLMDIKLLSLIFIDLQYCIVFIIIRIKRFTNF